MKENQGLRVKAMVTKVWRRNIDVEMARMEQCLKNFPLIAFDTEYPGIIYHTYSDSSDEEWYRVMKANVESTKLIQCGFTLFNAKGVIGGSWEFNFSNFGDTCDLYNQNSIDFLISHGLDLMKIRKEGFDMFDYMFFPKLLYVFRSQRDVEFVTFQGAYDFAYFISILNYGKLPETHGEFALEVVRVFGQVYDLKVMAGFCEGLGENLGLSKLAQILNITRIGRAHHAGSDSLLTALVFIKLKHGYEDSNLARGMLYGIGKRNLVTPSLMCPQKLVSYPSSSMMCQKKLVSYPSSDMMCHQKLVSYPSSDMMCQEKVVVSCPSSDMMFNNGDVPNYDQPPVFFRDGSGIPWMFYNGMYVNQLNHLPLSTLPYPNQTTPFASDYTGLLHNYYNTNASFD